MAHNYGCMYEGFLAYRYPRFFENEGPMKAGKWIKDLEGTFEISGCIEHQKVLYVSYFLQGEMVVWWDTKRHMLIMDLESMEAITWDRFKNKFNDHFLPAIVKQ